MDYYLAKKEPNRWILFTQKVDSALDAAGISSGSRTVSKQFASSLKDIKPYDEWTDDDIVEAWDTWEKPEQSKSGKAEADAAAEYERLRTAFAAAAAAPKKERKKRTPMTQQQKAAKKAKRNATRGAFNENEDLSSSAQNAAEQKAVRNLNARESERAANLIFPRQNHTRRKPMWGIPNVGSGFGGSRKRRRSRKN